MPKNGQDISALSNVPLNSYNPTSDAGLYQLILKHNATGCEADDTQRLGTANAACPTGVTITYNGTAVDYTEPTIGSTVTLTAAIQGASEQMPAPSYKWYKNGVLISGATSNTYTISSYQLSNAGIYKVEVTLSGCTTLTDQISLGPTNCLLLTLKSDGVERTTLQATPGQNITLTADVGGVTGVTYQWKKDNVVISGQTTNSLTLSNFSTTMAGDYCVVATKSGCTTETKCITINYQCENIQLDGFVNSTFAGSSNSATQKVYAKVGDRLDFAVTDVHDYYYTWNVPASVYVPTNAKAYYKDNLSYSDAGIYKVTAEKLGCNVSVQFELIVTCFDPLEEVYVKANDVRIGKTAAVSVGDNLQFVVKEISGATYQWTGPNGYSSTVSMPTLSNVTQAMAGRYSITVSKNGCSQSDFVDVTIGCTQLNNVLVYNNSPNYEIKTGETLQLWSNKSGGGYIYNWTGPNGFQSNWATTGQSNVTSAYNGQYCLQLGYVGCTNTVTVCTTARILDCTGAFSVSKSNCNVTTGTGNLVVTVTAKPANAIAEYKIEEIVTDEEGNISYQVVPGFLDFQSSNIFSGIPSKKYRVWVRLKQNVTINEQGTTAVKYCTLAPQEFTLYCDPCLYTYISSKNASGIVTKKIDVSNTGSIQALNLEVKKETGTDPYIPTALANFSWDGPNGTTATTNPWNTRKLPGYYKAIYQVTYNSGQTKSCSSDIILTMDNCTAINTELPYYRTYCSNGSKYITLVPFGEIGDKQLSLDNNSWTVGETLALPGNDTHYTVYVRNGDFPSCISSFDVDVVPTCCFTAQSDPTLQELFIFNNPIINCTLTGTTVSLSAYYRLGTTGTADYTQTEYRILKASDNSVVADWQGRNNGSWSNFTNLPAGDYIAEARLIGKTCIIRMNFKVDALEPLAPVSYNCDIKQSVSLGETTLDIDVETQTSFSGYALELDGIKDYVNASAPATTTKNNFTVEMWINPDRGQAIRLYSEADKNYSTYAGYNQQRMLLRGASTSTESCMNVSVGGNGINIIEQRTGSQYDIVASIPLDFTGWTHLAISCDGTNYKLYLNGELNGTYPLRNPTFPVLPPYLIGSAGYGYYKGGIDDARFWSVVRTPAEIKANYSKVLTPIPTPYPASLYRYHRFDVINGTTIKNEIAGQPTVTIPYGNCNTYQATYTGNDNLNLQPVFSWYNGSTLIATGNKLSVPTPTVTTTYTVKYTKPDGAICTNNITVPITLCDDIAVTVTPSQTVTEESGIQPLLSASITNPDVKPMMNLELETSLSFTGNEAANIGNYTTAQNNITIEFWAKPTRSTETSNTNDPNAIVHKYLLRPGWAPNSDETSFGLTLGTNGLILLENSSSYYNVRFKYNANLSGWNHYAVVYEDKKPRLYINGELVYSSQTQCPRNVKGIMEIGRNDDRGFQGFVDNFRIWSNARSAQEIKEYFDKDVVAVEPCIGYWKFDRSSGLVLDTQSPKIIKDLSQHERPITLNGSASVTTTNQTGSIVVDPKITWYLEKEDPSDGSIRQERVGIGNQYLMPLDLLVKGKAGKYNYIVKFVKRDNTICEKRKTITVLPVSSTTEISCFTIQSAPESRTLTSGKLGDGLKQYGGAYSEDRVWKRIKQPSEDSYHIISTFNGLAWKNTNPPNIVTLETPNNLDNTQRWKFELLANGNYHIVSKANTSTMLYNPPWGSGDGHPMIMAYTTSEYRSEFTVAEVTCPTQEKEEDCTSTGEISYQRWEGITGSTIADLIPKLGLNPTYEGTITQFEQGYLNINNFGTRIRGYVCPPQTGYYTFWTAGDDAVELYLSTDETPALKRKIAFNNYSTGIRDYTQNESQRSDGIPLYKNKKYYIEVLHKESYGGNGVSVRWQTPTSEMMEPLPGQYLSPYIDPTKCNITGITVNPAKKEIVVGQFVDFAVEYTSNTGSTTVALQDYIFDWTGSDKVNVNTPTLPDGTTNYVSAWQGKTAKAKPLEPGEYIYKVARNDLPSCYAEVKIIVKEIECGCTDCGADGAAIATQNPDVTYYFNKPGYNYVVENTHLDGSFGGSVAQTITYFDGLGRPIQKITRAAGPKQEDVVTPIEYDAFGRTPKNYLPFAIANNGGNFVTGGGSNSNSFYGGLTTIKDANKSRAYTETIFESSPLNRITSQKQAGEQGNVAIGTNYITNAANEVPLLYYDYSTQKIIRSGNYAPNRLLITEVKDQQGTPSKEYKNLSGEVILKTVGDHKTYYVYDDFGQLRCVIPPEAESLTAASFNLYTTTDVLFFAYNYDARGRMTYKKVPGWSVAQTMSYDTRDRLTSEVLPTGHTINYTYDDFNRLLTKADNGTIVTSNTYDSYSGAVAVGSEGFHTPDQSVPLAKGRLVTTQNAVIGGSLLATTVYTDDLGRTVQTASQNHTGGTDYAYQKIDFTGRVLRTKQAITHQGVGTTVKVEQAMAYDYGNRMIATCQRVDDGSKEPFWEPVARNNYDAIGQLKAKILGCKLQTLDYTYNMVGWLRTFNDPGNLASKKDFFGMALTYNAVGNITKQDWNYAYRSSKHLEPAFNLKQATAFNDTYGYDIYNRITSHNSLQGGSQKLALTNSYDKNGNIKSLTRTITGTAVDNLSYNYTANSNRVSSIVDAGSGDSDPIWETFKPKGTGSYAYDNAGNITNDPYKGTGNITYNFLNLPSQIPGANVTNTYNATGQKVRASTPSGTYDYLGPVVFKNNAIEFVQTPEGRVLPPGAVKQNAKRYAGGGIDTTNVFWRYEYSLKDHLGNLRVACRCAEKVETEQKDRFDGYNPIVVQQTHYDAWGVRLPLFGNPDPYYGKPHDRYRYNGKEYVSELSWYEYGFRIYDPVTTRFISVDRFAEKYYSHSDYHYALNNPISNIDINGDSTYRFDGNTGAYLGLFDTDQRGQIGSYGNMQTIGKGKKKQEVWNGEYFDFADPINDSKQIRDGQINHLEIISDNKIQSLMQEQGAFETGMVNFAWQSQGSKNFDYAFTILKDKYPDSKFDGEKSNTLFLPKGEHTAHNFGNFGNYLWGATGYTAGFGYRELSGGAHFNSIVNPRRNGYPSQWDSKDDQNSIKKGIYHAQMFKYRNLRR